MQLFAKIKKSSKYFYQNRDAENDPRYGLPFKVTINPEYRRGANADYDDYCVKGGPGGQYCLSDLNLFMQRSDGVFFRIN